MVEKLSDLNAGIRAECDEQDVSPVNAMCLCEGYGQRPEILVSDADWIKVEFQVALDS